MAWSFPPSLLGISVSGDLGDTTLYTNRHGKVVTFPRSPPTKPPTPQQLEQRARFAAAIAGWNAAADTTRAAYQAITLRCSIPFTGLNLWIALSFSQDQNVLDTVIAHSGVFAPMPPGV